MKTETDWKAYNAAREIDISALLASDDFVPFDLSNNAATLGQAAGRLTWEASKECARDYRPPLIDTPERKEAFISFVESSGFSEAGEMPGWSDEDLNALLLQWIAGDIREAFGDAPASEWDWADYQERSERGSVSSTLFRADDGRIFFSINQ